MQNEQKNNQTADQEISLKNDEKVLEQFSDLSGISVKNLNFGLWWVQNSKNVKRISFTVLIIIGALSWLYTMSSYGYYLAVGMAKDNQMIAEMTQQTKTIHDYVIANAPRDLAIGDLQIVRLNDQIDLFAPVTNPNEHYYASLSYDILSAEQVIYHSNDFILPGETKSIMALGLKPADVSGNLQIRIGATSWRRIDNHEIADWPAFRDNRIDFGIEGAQYRPANDSGLSEIVNLGQIEFNVTNNTAYNYNNLPLQVFLKSYDRVVGLTIAHLDGFASGEKRVVRINFPGLSGSVDQIDIVPDIDITRTDIYDKFTGTAN